MAAGAVKGSKTERRPGSWRLRVFVGNDAVTGAKRYRTETFHGTERQAETALSKLVADVAGGNTAAPKSITLAGLLDRYADHAESVGRSPTTVDSYRRQARNLQHGIGRMQLAKLRPEHLDELYLVLGTRGVPGGRGGFSPASVNRYHAVISAALAQAVRWGWLERNPAARATPPRISSVRMTAPSPAELRQLIEAATASRRPENALLIAVAAMTGARRGELCALRWSDVDLAEGVAHIRRALKQVGKRISEGDTKTHQERSVALPAPAVAMLRRYRLSVEALSEQTEIPLVADPFVFSPDVSGGRPARPMVLTQMFARTAKACGLPYHLHQLRHFAATQLIAAGHDPVTVANRLGHADPSITLRVYAHAIESRDRAAADTLGGIVSPELTEGTA